MLHSLGSLLRTVGWNAKDFHIDVRIDGVTFRSGASWFW